MGFFPSIMVVFGWEARKIFVIPNDTSMNPCSYLHVARDSSTVVQDSCRTPTASPFVSEDVVFVAFGRCKVEPITNVGCFGNPSASSFRLDPTSPPRATHALVVRRFLVFHVASARAFEVEPESQIS